MIPYIYSLVLPDAVQVIDSAQEQRAVDDGRGRPAHFPNRVFAENLEFGAGIDNMSGAGVIETKYFAAVCPGGRCEAACSGEPLLVHLFAGLRIIAAQQAAAFLENIKMSLVKQRRRGGRPGLG